MSRGGRRCRPRQAERRAIRAPSKGSQVIVGYDSIVFVMTTIEALPDDPGMLKAMLLAERAESERLARSSRNCNAIALAVAPRPCPKSSFNWRWRRRSNSRRRASPEKEVTTSAEGNARAAKRRANRGALPAHLPRIETVVDIASPDVGRPRPGSSGPMPGTTGHGAGPILPALPMFMRPTARRSGRSPILLALRACYRSMATPGAKCWWCKALLSSPFAGAMSAARSVNSRRAGRRRSRPRL